MMIEKIAQILEEKKDLIDEWFKSKNITWPIYGSFDIRDSGFKAVVVDSNVFPGGWNNICKECEEFTKEAFYNHIISISPNAKKVLILAEDADNPYYYENILNLKKFLDKFEVELGLTSFDAKTKKTATTELEFKAVARVENKLVVGDFIPDFILNNDDLSITEIKPFENLDQTIMPPVHLGWNKRTKHDHFAVKAKIMEEITEKLGLDEWLFGSYFDYAENVNFKDKEGLEAIAEKIDALIAKIQKKYDEYNVNETPYVFVKGSSSTYGMNALHFHSGQEFLDINSADRRKMHKAKGGRVVDTVMIQEGVPTNKIIEGNHAEAVIYAVADNAVGGFFRTHPTKGNKGNLSAKGMTFKHSDLCYMHNKGITKPEVEVYTFLAKLGMLAIANEMAVHN